MKILEEKIKKVAIAPISSGLYLSEEAISLLNDIELIKQLEYKKSIMKNPELALDDYTWITDDMVRERFPDSPESELYDNKLNMIRECSYLVDDDGNFYGVDCDDIKRDDEKLVRIIEELGEKAYPRLKIYDDGDDYYRIDIIKIPYDMEFHITEYDNSCGEVLEEAHRVWHYNSESDSVQMYRVGGK